MTGAAAGPTGLPRSERSRPPGVGSWWLDLPRVLLLVAFLAAPPRPGRSDGAGSERRAPDAGGAPRRTSNTEPGRADGPDGDPAPPSVSDQTAGASGRRPGGTASSSGPEAHPTAAGPAPRASDAEREATAATVRRAMAEGRLTLDEGVARLDAAFVARHRGQLDELVADLPTDPRPRRTRWSGVARDLRDFAVLAAVAAAVVQALTGLWALWPIAVGALVPLALLGQRLPGAHGEPEGGRLGDGASADGSERLPPS